MGEARTGRGMCSVVVLRNVDVVRKKSVCELRRGTLGDAFRLYYSALSAGMRRSNGEKRAQKSVNER